MHAACTLPKAPAPSSQSEPSGRLQISIWSPGTSQSDQGMLGSSMELPCFPSLQGCHLPSGMQALVARPDSLT